MKAFLAAMATSFVVFLAGCQQEQAEQPSEPEQSKAEQSQASEPAPAREEGPSEEPAQAARDTETITNEACLTAARQQTGEPEIRVTSNEFLQANTLVMLGVGPQNAPWRCLVSNDGNVAELSFEGDDSAGVPDQPASGSDISGMTVDACLAAAVDETSERNVSVLSTEFSEANSLVMVGVGDQRAPWRCLVSNDAQVLEVTSQTDEGNL